MFCLGHFGDVLQLPLHGRQSLHSRESQERPVRLALLDGKQEALLGVREFRLELRDQPLPGADERLVFHMLLCHRGELGVEDLPQVLAGGIEDFVHRTVVADELDQESLPDFRCHPSVVQQMLDVEEVARMLAVQRRAYLAAEELRLRDGPRLDRDLEDVARPLGELARRRRIHGAPHDGVRLDLHFR